jgi:hypothetical protein
MRATLHVPAARDPEVLERLDSTPLCNLCHLYQKCLNKNAVKVSADQDKLSKDIIAVSSQIVHYASALVTPFFHTFSLLIILRLTASQIKSRQRFTRNRKCLPSI